MFPLGSLKRDGAQNPSAYGRLFQDEAEGDTVISVRITEQKNTYKVEMTMPYMGHYTSHGKPGAGDFLPRAG